LHELVAAGVAVPLALYFSDAAHSLPVRIGQSSVFALGAFVVLPFAKLIWETLTATSTSHNQSMAPE